MGMIQTKSWSSVRGKLVAAGVALGATAILAAAPLPALASSSTLLDADTAAHNWVATYGGSGSSTIDTASLSTVNAFESAIAANDDRIAAVGAYNASRMQTDAAFVLFDGQGVLQKEDILAADRNDGFGKVIQTADGGFVAVGYTSGGGAFKERGITAKEAESASDFDGVICKYDANGDFVKGASFGGSAKEQFRDVVELSDGSLLVAGYTASDDGDLQDVHSSTSRDVLVMKYDANLEQGQVVDIFGGTASKFDEAKAIAAAPDGSFAVAGYQHSDDGAFEGLHHGANNMSDAFVAAYDAAGNRVGITAFGGTGNDYFNDLAFDTATGGFVASGYTESADGDLAGSGVSEDVSAALVAQVKADGSIAGSGTFGAEGDTTAEGIIALDGAYVVAGTYKGTLAEGVSSRSGSNDVYVAQVALADANASVLGAASLGCDVVDAARSLTLGNDADLLVVGTTRGDDFEGVEIESTGKTAAFLASVKAEAVLPSVKEVVDAAAALPAADNVAVADADAVNAAKDAYDKLPAALKALVPAASVSSLQQVEKALDAALEAAKPADADKPAPAEEAPAVKKGGSYEVGGSTYKVAKLAKGKAAGAVTLTAAKGAKSVSIPASVKLADGKAYAVTAVAKGAFAKSKATKATLGKNVAKLAAGAFKGSKVKTLVLKTKKLAKKSAVKGSLKSSKVSTVQVKVGSKKQNKAYAKKYAKAFTKANAGKKPAVK